MKLGEKGGIEVYVAAEKPEGVPEENWLPYTSIEMNRTYWGNNHKADP